MSDARSAASPRLFTARFVTLLGAQAGFGYAFSSFLLLPKFVVWELDGSADDIGLIEAIHGLPSVLLMPIIGGWVDRVGRRGFLTGGALLMAACCLAFAWVDSVGPLLYGLRALQGLAFAMAFTGGATLAVDQAPAERLAQAIGLFGLTFLSMNAVAPAALEAIAERHGWSTGFAGAAAAALLCALLSRFLRDRRIPAAQTATEGTLSAVWAFARRPRQLRTSAVIALAGAALGVIFRFYQPYARELGVERVGSFFVSYALLAVAVRVGLGERVDRSGRRRVALGCLVAYVAILLGMSRMQAGMLVWFGGAMGATHGLFYPAFNAVAAEGVEPGERGKMMSLFQGMWQAGFALAQLGLGLLAERRGYPTVFVAGALCAALAWLVLSLSPEGRRRPGPDPS